MNRSLRAAVAVAGLAIGLLGASAKAETWDELVAAAKKEGQLVIAVHDGQTLRDARTKGWAEDFPDIKMQIINVSDQEIIPRILREKTAGIYSLDITFGGCTDFNGVFRKNDLLRPFREAIVDKSLLDDKIWRNGFDDGFCDLEKTWGYAYDRTVISPAYVNWDFVDRKALTSLDDLLKPEFNGKIVWQDPRQPGAGYAFASGLYQNKGDEYLTKLWKMDAVYTPNRRLAAEWLVRGRYPIGLGVGQDQLKVFQDQGLCKNCELLPAEWYSKPIAGSGNANIAYLKNTPHPAATKLYINWFLQQKQQQRNAEITGRASRRLDTKEGAPGAAPRNDLKYIDVFDEEHLPGSLHTLALAKQVISIQAVEK